MEECDDYDGQPRSCLKSVVKRPHAIIVELSMSWQILMNDHSSLICHVNLANGFRGGERQTMLLIKSLSERGFKQKLIARNNSELSTRCQSIDDLDVIEANLFSFDAFSKASDKTLLHFHDSRSFPLLYIYSLFRGLNYIYTRRVERNQKWILSAKKFIRMQES